MRRKQIYWRLKCSRFDHFRTEKGLVDWTMTKPAVLEAVLRADVAASEI
jgi:hypothetical protein